MLSEQMALLVVRGAEVLGHRLGQVRQRVHGVEGAQGEVGREVALEGPRRASPLAHVRFRDALQTHAARLDATHEPTRTRSQTRLQHHEELLAFAPSELDPVTLVVMDTAASVERDWVALLFASAQPFQEPGGAALWGVTVLLISINALLVVIDGVVTWVPTRCRRPRASVHVLVLDTATQGRRDVDGEQRLCADFDRHERLHPDGLVAERFIARVRVGVTLTFTVNFVFLLVLLFVASVVDSERDFRRRQRGRAEVSRRRWGRQREEASRRARRRRGRRRVVVVVVTVAPRGVHVDHQLVHLTRLQTKQDLQSVQSSVFSLGAVDLVALETKRDAPVCAESAERRLRPGDTAPGSPRAPPVNGAAGRPGESAAAGACTRTRQLYKNTDQN